MMKPILFVDSVCPEPYDLEKLKAQKFGGTEATVIRIVEKLSRKIPIVVSQHNRRETTFSDNVTYTPFYPHHLTKQWQAVVVLRRSQTAISMRDHLKDVPMWVWMHDLIDFSEFSALKAMGEKDIGYIVVSDFHHEQLLKVEALDPYLPVMPKARRIYNPIDDTIVPDDTPVNKNKLIFASSPHKGLKYTLEIFQIIKARYPQFELVITNPGYIKYKSENIPGVHYLGSLNYEENLQHLRESLCLFYPNHIFPETFGLVLVDANAVGTPVLTHPFGAAPEILADPQQIVNTHDIEAISERLMQWWGGDRPKLCVQKKFQLSHVVEEWENLLLKDQ